MNVGILAHLLDTRPGYRQAGVSRYIEFLIRELPSASPDQFVVYGGRHSQGVSDGLRDRSGLRWSRSVIPTGRPQSRILWEQSVAPALLERDQIDVVHATVNVLPVISGRASVVTVHDLAFLRFPGQYPSLKQRYLSALTRRSVLHADRVIAVSENTRHDILMYYPVNPDKVQVVPNGVDAALHPLTELGRLTEFRQRHALPSEFLLFLGTLQPRKNLIGLLRGWSRLDERERLPLVVVGAQGWMYEPIYDEARALGVAGEVIFAGFAEPTDLIYWYNAATVFIYPSLYEGFGMPVLEAMACGTPVIAASTSSIPEVAGDAALLADPDDVGALSTAIGRLSSDTDLRATLSQRGIGRAAMFSWARTARETADVYRAALTTHESKRKD